MPDDTEQLTAAMARGDRAAVAAFYDRYFPVLYRCARAALRGRRADDEHACLDVVHDAVLRIVRTVQPVTGGEGQLVAWLRLVVQSVAYDLLRREQRRKLRERSARRAGGPAGVDAGADASSSHHPGNGAELAEQLAWLRDQLRRLDPGLVEVIELRYQHRWTLAAIGARLGVSPGTVDGRLRRALSHMREHAREAFGDEP